MAILTHDTWVVVADGEKALVLRNETDAANPHLVVVSKREQDNPPDREQATDRPGRMADRGPGQRSALEETDFHDLAEATFAASLADHLYHEAHRGKFTRLVLVAGPQVLGRLRSALHKEVQDKVVAEVAKTLTNHPVTEIETHLKAEFSR